MWKTTQLIRIGTFGSSSFVSNHAGKLPFKTLGCVCELGSGNTQFERQVD